MTSFDPLNNSYPIDASGGLSNENALKLRKEVLSSHGRRIVVLKQNDKMHVGVFSKKEIKQAIKEGQKKGIEVFSKLEQVAENLDELGKKQIGSIARTYTFHRKEERLTARSKRFRLFENDEKQKRISQAAATAGGIGEVEKKEANIKELVREPTRNQIFYYDLETEELKTADSFKGLNDNACIKLSNSVHYFLTGHKISYEDKVALAVNIVQNAKKYPSSEVSKALEYLLKNDIEKDEGCRLDILRLEAKPPKDIQELRGELIRQLFKVAKHLPKQLCLSLQGQLFSILVLMGRSDKQIDDFENLDTSRREEYKKLHLSLDPKQKLSLYKEIKSCESDWPSGKKHLITTQLNRILSPQGYIQAFKEINTLLKQRNRSDSEVIMKLQELESMPGFHNFLKSLDTKQRVYKEYKNNTSELKKDFYKILYLNENQRTDLAKEINNLLSKIEILTSSPRTKTQKNPDSQFSDLSTTFVINKKSKQLEAVKKVDLKKHIHMGCVDVAILGVLATNECSITYRKLLAECLLIRKNNTKSSQEKKEINQALEYLLTFSDTNEKTLGSTSKERFDNYLDLKTNKKISKPKFASLTPPNKFQSLDKFAKSIFGKDEFKEGFIYLKEQLDRQRIPPKQIIARLKALPGLKEYLKNFKEIDKAFKEMCRNFSNQHKYRDAYWNGASDLVKIEQHFQIDLERILDKEDPNPQIEMTSSTLSLASPTPTNGFSQQEIKLTIESGERLKMPFSTTKGITGKKNEDRVLVNQMTLGDQNVRVMGVADGRGGDEASIIVRNNFSSLFDEFFWLMGFTEITKKSIEQTAQKVLTQMHQAIQFYNKKNTKKCETTLSVNILVPQNNGTTTAYNISVGDAESWILNPDGYPRQIPSGYSWDAVLKEEKDKVYNDLQSWTQEDVQLTEFSQKCKNSPTPRTLKDTLQRIGFLNSEGKLSRTAPKALNQIKDQIDKWLDTEENNLDNSDTQIQALSQDILKSVKERHPDAPVSTLRPDEIALRFVNRNSSHFYIYGNDDKGLNARLYMHDDKDKPSIHRLRFDGRESPGIGLSNITKPRVTEHILNNQETIISASDSLSAASEKIRTEKIVKQRVQKLLKDDVTIKSEELKNGITKKTLTDANGNIYSYFEEKERKFGHCALKLLVTGKNSDTEGEKTFTEDPNDIQFLLLERGGREIPKYPVVQSILTSSYTNTDDQGISMEKYHINTPKTAVERMCLSGEDDNTTIVMTTIGEITNQTSRSGASDEPVFNPAFDESYEPVYDPELDERKDDGTISTQLSETQNTSDANPNNEEESAT